VFLHRPSFEAWPQALQHAMQDAVTQSVAYQRKLAEEEHASSRKTIEAAGCEIYQLNANEHAAFVHAVQPLVADARKMYDEAMFEMVP
jgi:TRAP-type C4-dicarboxylate transport system substrate-binding protein